MSEADTSGRTAAVIFAALATAVALPVVAFVGFIGIWTAAVPCHPGGHGGCTPAGVVAAVSALVALAAPVFLWFRVRRPGPTSTAVVVGLIGLIAGPLISLGLMSLTLNLFG